MEGEDLRRVGRLFGQHPVQARRLLVERNHPVHDRGQGVAQRRRLVDERLERGPGHLLGLGHVSPHELDDDRVLVREVLVERSDRDPGSLGDAIGRAGGVAVALENVSSRLQDRLDRLARTLLTRAATRFQSGCRRHFERSQNASCA